MVSWRTGLKRFIGFAGSVGLASNKMAFFSSVASATPVSVERAGGTITVTPKSGMYHSVVVLTHGLGDTAEGFADVAEMFAQRLDGVKFILPTAPRQPVSLNGGMVMPSWYDITGLSDRASEDAPGIQESMAKIQSILDAESSKGIPYSQMLLAGFSQGGALSLFTGLQQPASKKLAGVLILSGYLAAKSKFVFNPDVKDTPVLHCHGTIDPMVRFDWAEKTKEAIVGMGATNYELRPFQGLQHSVSPEELGIALEFIRKCLAENTPTKPLEEMSVSELKNAIQRAGLGNQAVGLLEKQEFVDLLKKNQAASKQEL